MAGLGFRVSKPAGGSIVRTTKSNPSHEQPKAT